MARSTWIRLQGLEFTGRHCVLPGEEHRPTRFLVDLEVRGVPTESWPGPGLEHCLDYRRLEALAREALTTPSQNTLESLAHQLADRIAALEGVEEYRVRICKPSPPLETPTRSAEVEVHGAKG